MTGKIVDYVTIAVPIDKPGITCLERLDEKVKDAMKDGWQPFAGVTAVSATLIQIMVKYESTSLQS